MSDELERELREIHDSLHEHCDHEDIGPRRSDCGICNMDALRRAAESGAREPTRERDHLRAMLHALLEHAGNPKIGNVASIVAGILGAAAEDTARLDWLEQNGLGVGLLEQDRDWIVTADTDDGASECFIRGVAKGLRAAIDAARVGGKP